MIPGRRVEIDLDDDGLRLGDEVQNDSPKQGAFISDVLERKSSVATPPAPPSLKSKTGFPEHRRRNVESRFKQQKTLAAVLGKNHAGQTSSQSDHQNNAAIAGKAKSWEEEEKQRIDLENRQKLAQMSPEEIEEERRELMKSLSPDLIQRLLQRSNIDNGSTEEDLSSRPQPPSLNVAKDKSTSKTVSFADLEEAKDGAKVTVSNNDPNDNDIEAPVDHPLAHDSVHFPRPRQPPDLDPSSETFLEDLHSKYFPSLPSNPEKLEWMQSSSQGTSAYDPSSSTLSAKDLRFSFKGELIPPRLAAEIPVTSGLHHHGNAPDAAGYTVSELAHLAQSSYPAQRCIAFQTLGRILYRLGKGEFGDSGEPGDGTVGVEDTFGELARGLWREVEKERVIEILARESEGQGVDRGRHVSAKAYATEAVWLWQKGGGRRWNAS